MAMVRENNRRRVLGTLLWGTVGLCAPLLLLGAPLLLGTYLQGRGDARQAGLMCVVALMGVVGAYVSVQRRLQNTADGGDPVIGVLALHEFNAVLHFPLISGGVFAVLLYLLLAAKFVTGSLFPDLSSGVPDGLEQWAKLLIWAFIAGFAERLVPDTLDRLVHQAAQGSEAASTEGAATGSGRLPRPNSPAPDPDKATAVAARRVADFHAKAPTPPPV